MKNILKNSILLVLIVTIFWIIPAPSFGQEAVQRARETVGATPRAMDADGASGRAAVAAPTATIVATPIPTPTPTPTLPIPPEPSTDAESSILDLPAESNNSGQIGTTPTPTPTSTILSPQNGASQNAENNNRILYTILAAFSLAIISYGASRFLRQNTKQKNDGEKENQKCDSIKELLDQKIKEAEESIKNWPKEKIEKTIKEYAVNKFLNEQEKTLLKQAESAKEKYDKLKETIDLLQGKYDICKLKLVTGKTKKLFITGIPTAGKSYLAEKLTNDIGCKWVSTDDLREELAKDSRYKKWVNFYLDQDEYEYYTTIGYNQQWKNLVKQSEKIWPGIFEKIMELDKGNKPIIFEGVNILPHLAKKHLNFPGIVLIGKSFEAVFERNIKNPRWGASEKLQKLESDAFFYGERVHYKQEAEKYGYPVFETADEAFKEALKQLK